MTENILQVSMEGRIGRQDISAFYLLSSQIILYFFCYPAV